MSVRPPLKGLILKSASLTERHALKWRIQRIISSAGQSWDGGRGGGAESHLPGETDCSVIQWANINKRRILPKDFSKLLLKRKGSAYTLFTKLCNFSKPLLRC